MEKDLKSGKQINPSIVKTQLDEILAREIISFIDVGSEDAMMSFNLATISCITIIVEREREIRQYADFPPERYRRESFTSELVDIGLENDDYLENAISASLKSGYISEDENRDFKAEMPAFMAAGFLDSMFPGMQGMNLIAFVLQMHHEVISGRKTLELAKQSFESSLKSSGVSVSRDHAEKRASEMASSAQTAPALAKKISKKLKKENLDRLSTLMKTRKKRSDEYTQKVQVKDVFDKGPSKEEIAAHKAEIEKAEIARKDAELARQLAEKDERIKQAENAARNAATQLKELEEKELALDAAREKAAELAAREAQMAEREAQLKAMEERIKQKEEDQARREQEARQKNAKIQDAKAQDAKAQDAKAQDAKALEEKEIVTSEEDIESRIAAFESELAMPCPLCAIGKIEEKTTEKGKQFFSCTKADCRFVSWDKPYHFECPLCKNPFLIEMKTTGDEKGLKCPRAACSYTQNNLLDPKQNMASAAAGSKPKKKRRVVRRKRR